MSVIKIPSDLSPMTVSGAKNTLYLIPAKENAGTPAIFLFRRVGAGQPAQAFNNRWIAIGEVNENVNEGALRAAIESHAEELCELSDSYQGSEWDGYNFIGKWSESDLEVYHQTPDWLSSVPNNWSASDWYDPAGGVIACCVLSDLSLDEFVTREIDEALKNDAYLSESDVRAYVVRSAKDWLDEMDDEELDEEDSRYTQIRNWCRRIVREA